MKLKPVLNVKDLKAGYYIRAFVNHLGRASVEVVKVHGKPFISKTETMGKSWKIKTFSFYYRNVEDSYVSSLIGVSLSYHMRLFPYKPKTYLYLQSLLGDRNRFLAAFMNIEFSQSFVASNESEWEYNNWRDSEMEKMHNRS